MEHRGEKLSDKGNTSTLQWCQNGGGEEEFGCADGLDEEIQAAKPAEEPPRTFHIPRKSKEKRGALTPLFDHLPVILPTGCITNSVEHPS